MAIKSCRKQLFAVARSLARPIYGGVGAILCLHRVVPRESVSILPDNRTLEITTEDLENLICEVRASGYDIIPIEEVPAALSQKRRSKFVVFTFDDGYLDNFTEALPIFRKNSAPFTVYVTTGLIDGAALPWWYLLEELLKSAAVVRFSDGNKEQNLPLNTLPEKSGAFLQLARHIRNNPQEAANAFVRSLFNDSGLNPDVISRNFMMSWTDIQKMASDDLVTIGAHSVNHFVFSRLSVEGLRTELVDAKKKLETELKRPVDHLAFPFGGKNAVCSREFDAARDAGYVTAVTTRGANLFPDHKHHLQALPRLTINGHYDVVKRFRDVESGVISAREFGLRRVVTE